MQVEARMLLVARVYGDQAPKNPNIDKKDGAYESQISFRVTDDMALLGLLNRDMTVDAINDVPTPAECRVAAKNQLLMYVPAQFTVPNPSILPDYTQAGVQAHVWNEQMHKWVKLAVGGGAFGTAFEVHSGGNPLVRYAKVYNGGTIYDLAAGMLVVVQSRNV